jgi:single-stranded DNA-binding protein
MSMQLYGCGYLVSDPIIEEMNNGEKKSYCVKFTLSINEVIKGGQEEKRLTHYLPFEAFDSGAQAIAKIAKRGDTMMVWAIPRQYKWTNAEEEKRSKIVFRVEKFKIFKNEKSSVSQ